MASNKKILKYILTVCYNSKSNSVELLSEELVDDINDNIGNNTKPILFKGNTWILDYIDDESLRKINVFEIAET